MIRRSASAIAFAAALLGAGAAPAAGAPPPIKHVFIIVLENKDADRTFGESTEAPYLANELRSKGGFLPNYYGIGHLSLTNYIAMVSGQAPNPQTQSDCQFFTNFSPGTPTSDGQYIGQGCVHPPGVGTIAGQLEGAGFTWRGYMEDMNKGAPPGEEAPCRHPSINAADDTQTAEVGDQYAARHNPFVYFHSIIDLPTCQQNVVDFSHLARDLRSPGTTPNYSFITPNLCNDAHDEPCVDGKPGGLRQSDAWLREHVPPILDSPTFKDHGLLIVTFDEAENEFTVSGDSSACCNEQPGPNTTAPGGISGGPGGGRIGAVLLSPCIEPGTVDETPYNHYSMLRSVEDVFGLGHLGFAGQSGLDAFGGKIYTHRPCVDMNLQVHPKKAKLRQRKRFRFRVRSDAESCEQGVRIRFGGRTKRTNSHGKAKISKKFRRRGRHRAKATKPECGPDRARIKVRRR
jgi:hypothetical protein